MSEKKFTAQDAFKKTEIVGVAVVDQETFIFSANGDRNEGNRLISHNVSKDTWYWVWNTSAWNFAHPIGGKNKRGHKQALFADAGGRVMSFEYKDGPNECEPNMPLRGAKELAFIGSHFYAVGSGKKLLRREAAGDWTILSQVEGDYEAKRAAGNFTKAAGLTEDSVYISLQRAKSKSAICYWNGSELTEIALPSAVVSDIPEESMFINDIEVTPTGKVFVTGNLGELLVGDRGGFSVLIKGGEEMVFAHETPIIKALCWYDGRLLGLGGVDGHVKEYDQKEQCWVISSLAYGTFGKVHGTYIDANDEVLLLADASSVYLFKHNEWTMLK